jgi:hypothetical protein
MSRFFPGAARSRAVPGGSAGRAGNVGSARRARRNGYPPPATAGSRQSTDGGALPAVRRRAVIILRRRGRDAGRARARQHCGTAAGRAARLMRWRRAAALFGVMPAARRGQGGRQQQARSQFADVHLRFSPGPHARDGSVAGIPARISTASRPPVYSTVGRLAISSNGANGIPREQMLFGRRVAPVVRVVPVHAILRGVRPEGLVKLFRVEYRCEGSAAHDPLPPEPR